MLGYVTLGTNNIEKARAFYSALLGELGMSELFDNERLYFYGSDPAGPFVVVGGPYDAQAASVGNGVMVALKCEDDAKINAMHAKALELGAADEGAPGERVPGVFYGAYARDPDGNKLCFYKMGG
ncbi:MAG: VOC family protein [PS1 clade bacterium]|uniref:VOC family protein n=1 Tax=PS1 clade bacterium TaxID=2175152 RepID=A0A937HC74_9PROT|nr:VOC family protein [PS1 clade bacterium]